MTVGRDDDEGEGLAPVIPLFGGSGPAVARARSRDAAPAESARPSEMSAPTGGQPEHDDPGTDAAESWHTTWRGLGSEARLRPVPRIAIERRDGVRRVRIVDEIPGEAADATGAARREPGSVTAPVASPGQQGPDEPGADEVAERAERRLVRSLGTRGLSVSEARARLLQELPAETADGIVDRLCRMGALDDARLAEQLIHTSLARKKQGRRAVAQALAARGIPREVVDAALSALPDDDAERALEFARSKARQLLRYDDDTALRRLVGQLARRGFGGSLAMSAARRALDEARAPSGRVRFD
ncbi:regulatory protein RecX [Microbacterium sp. Marseille-Q6965]|uniref:regulatory protein RecX n=1 Tax=Microbacterium sp. Marseille-Q6965 TaxID=2965072 RepID=UPI0021B7BFDA|nr:regulatory protein RecX [Microbacterium sp. Marseille-Q6965]